MNDITDEEKNKIIRDSTVILLLRKIISGFYLILMVGICAYILLCIFTFFI